MRGLWGIFWGRIPLGTSLHNYITWPLAALETGKLTRWTCDLMDYACYDVCRKMYLKRTFPRQTEEKYFPNKILSFLHLLPQEHWHGTAVKISVKL